MNGQVSFGIKHQHMPFTHFDKSFINIFKMY